MLSRIIIVVTAGINFLQGDHISGRINGNSDVYAKCLSAKLKCSRVQNGIKSPLGQVGRVVVTVNDPGVAE